MFWLVGLKNRSYVSKESHFTMRYSTLANGSSPLPVQHMVCVFVYTA